MNDILYKPTLLQKNAHFLMFCFVSRWNAKIGAYLKQVSASSACYLFSSAIEDADGMWVLAYCLLNNSKIHAGCMRVSLSAYCLLSSSNTGFLRYVEVSFLFTQQ